jgi:ribosomal protein S18 acetylase RimI-like enzyme
MIPTDKPALRELFLQIRQQTFHWMDTSKFNISDFDKETDDEHIFVIHFNNTVAGFISFWQRDNFIHHLYIASEFQQKGLGTMLLQTLSWKFQPNRPQQIGLNRPRSIGANRPQEIGPNRPHHF